MIDRPTRLGAAPMPPRFFQEAVFGQKCVIFGHNHFNFRLEMEKIFGKETSAPSHPPPPPPPPSRNKTAPVRL